MNEPKQRRAGLERAGDGASVVPAILCMRADTETIDSPFPAAGRRLHVHLAVLFSSVCVHESLGSHSATASKKLVAVVSIPGAYQSGVWKT